MVLNEDVERGVLHQALKDLVFELQVGEQINDVAVTEFSLMSIVNAKQVVESPSKNLGAQEYRSTDERRLQYTPDAVHHVTPTTVLSLNPVQIGTLTYGFCL